MRFTQDRTPTCSRARIASYTVPLAQPAASAIASYDGKHLPVAALCKRQSSAVSTASAFALILP